MNAPLIVRSGDELDAYFDAGRDRPAFVFKHSLTCPVSHAAHAQFLDFAAGCRDADCVLIEVQPSRDLCREVERRTGVRHESPQAILLVGGQVRWHASHGRIRVQSLREALDGVTA